MPFTKFFKHPKKAESSPTKCVDDNPVTVTDFTRRAPFWGYRPMAYRIDPRLLGLKQELDGYLEELFKKGALDEANGDVLDSIISDHVRSARANLAQQRVTHADLIRSFGLRAAGDQQAFEAELASLREDLTKNLSEQRILRRLLNHSQYKEGGTDHEEEI